MTDPIHSTGRGGAGNIGPDSNLYTDGDIIREGIQGESDRPEYSAGRGGAGNIVHSPRSGTPVNNAPKTGTVPPPSYASADIIPETATRTAEGHENYHTGRGGQGNVHRDRFGGHSAPQPGQAGYHEGVLEKARHALGLDKGKHVPAPESTEGQLSGERKEAER